LGLLRLGKQLAMDGFPFRLVRFGVCVKFYLKPSPNKWKGSWFLCVFECFEFAYVLVWPNILVFLILNGNLLADNDAEAERKAPGVDPSTAAAAAALAAEMALPFRITLVTTPGPTPTPSCGCPPEE